MSTTEQTEQTTQANVPPPTSTLLGRAIAAQSPIRSGLGGSTLLRHLIIAVVLVAAGMALTYVLPTYRNYQVATVLIYVCVLAGLTVLTGLSGQISLGHGAFMFVGGFTTAFVQNALVDAGYVDARAFALGWTIWVSIAAGVVAALVAGLLIGLAAARLRGPYLAGVTLTVGIIVTGIATTFDVFNGDQGVSVHVPRKPASLGRAFPNEQWQAWVALFAAALVLLLLANLIHSRLGRNFRAVRDDEVAAELSGIHVARTQILAFVISATAAGLAGGLFVFLVRNAQPGSFDTTWSLYFVLAIVLGGLGSLTGAIWGALFLVFVPYYSNQIAEAAHSGALKQSLPLAFFGLALIIITVAAPGGIQNLVRRIGHWLRGLVRKPASG